MESCILMLTTDHLSSKGSHGKVPGGADARSFEVEDRMKLVKIQHRNSWASVWLHSLFSLYFCASEMTS